MERTFAHKRMLNKILLDSACTRQNRQQSLTQIDMRHNGMPVRYDSPTQIRFTSPQSLVDLLHVLE